VISGRRCRGDELIQCISLLPIQSTYHIDQFARRVKTPFTDESGPGLVVCRRGLIPAPLGEVHIAEFPISIWILRLKFRQGTIVFLGVIIVVQPECLTRRRQEFIGFHLGA
jgi:hypothetical protein